MQTGKAADLPRLFVFKDSSALPYIQAICTPDASNFAISSERLGISPLCHALHRSCRHIYGSLSNPGFSGTFSPSQLVLLLETCLPPGTLLYHEKDAVVKKAEDESMFLPAQAHQQLHVQQGAGSRRLKKASRRLLQQARAEFEENAAIDGGPFNVYALSEGQQLDLPIEKRQILSPSLWNLDRLDQKDLPLDGQYHYGAARKPGLGQGVTIYVLDTGIMAEHQEFRHASTSTNSNGTAQGTNTASTNLATPGGPSRVSCGYNIVNMTKDCTDLDGHGSHVAGTAGGLEVGVAKGVSLVAVKILDSQGLGTVSATVAGLDYVAAVHQKPAIVTLSLGVKRGNYSQALEDAVKSLVEDHGVTVIVAAGNLQSNSCDFSPAATPQAITVAASDLAPRVLAASDPGKTTGLPQVNNVASSPVQATIPDLVDGVYALGNQGACVDLFAPGVEIYSVCGGARRCGPNMTTSSYALASGTSMAVPHVAGAAALYLESRPEASPAEVAAALKAATTQGAILDSELVPGTPNLLLMVRGIEQQAMNVQAAQGIPALGKK